MLATPSRFVIGKQSLNAHKAKFGQEYVIKASRSRDVFYAQIDVAKQTLFSRILR